MVEFEVRDGDEVGGSILEKKNHCGRLWFEAKRRLEWLIEVVLWLEPGASEGIGVSEMPKMQLYCAFMPRCYVVSFNLF